MVAVLPDVRLPVRCVTKGQASGRIAKSSVPLSFLGELNPDTGRVDNAQSELNGRVISGLLLTFPEARGSTVGPYVLYGARKHGVGPAGIIVRTADAIVASAAVLAGIPCVAGADMEWLAEGDAVTVNATEGYLDLPEVEETQVVTSILQRPDGTILVLKRSGKVGTFPGRWAGVSGYLEPGRTPLEQAHIEIEEETRLPAEKVTLVREGTTVPARVGSVLYIVHPFLFRTDETPVQLDWEHTESQWLPPAALRGMECVPGLDRVLDSLGLGGRKPVPPSPH